jgi:hypothetical protein
MENNSSFIELRTGWKMKRLLKLTDREIIFSYIILKVKLIVLQIEFEIIIY